MRRRDDLTLCKIRNSSRNPQNSVVTSCRKTHSFKRGFQHQVCPLIKSAVFSHLQGAATLVGDTTAIMLGSALDMSFLDFIFYDGKPGMFFMVELGACLSACIVYFTFRKEKGSIPKSGQMTEVTDYVPTVLLFGAIGLLILASFAPESWNLPAEINGIICCCLLVIGLIYNYIENKNMEILPW